jgi:hypothetical protein
MLTDRTALRAALRRLDRQLEDRLPLFVASDLGVGPRSLVRQRAQLDACLARLERQPT